MYGGTPTRSRSSSPSTGLSLSHVRNGENRKNAVALGRLGALHGGGGSGVGEAASIASLKITAAAAAVHASALASQSAAEGTTSNESGRVRLTSSTSTSTTANTTTTSSTSATKSINTSTSSTTVLGDRRQPLINFGWGSSVSNNAPIEGSFSHLMNAEDEQYVKSILSGANTANTRVSTHQPSSSPSVNDEKGALLGANDGQTSSCMSSSAATSAVTEEMLQLQPAMCPSPSHLKEEIKMVLCVRKDLKMGVGKMCAQCAHAAVAATQYCCSSKVVRSKDARTRQCGVWYALWDGYCGSKKVTVAIPDLAAMDEVTEKASTLGVPYFVVRDAGRTQVEAGSATVVAVGPAPSSLVDKITGAFKLL